MTDRKTGHFKDFGDDGNVIILLHGFLSSSKYWAKVQPYLTDAGCRVITIDLLGFGCAPKPQDSAYDYHDHVRYINSVITKLHIDTPFTLIGYSMGGLISARYAQVFSDTVKSLILLYPPLFTDTNQARTTLRNTGVFYRFLLDSRYRLIGWAFVKAFARSHIGNHTANSREKSLKNVIERASLFSDLKVITTQTLLLIGLQDRGEYLHNLTKQPVSRSVTITMENVTHHSPIQNPTLVQRRILDFIA